MRALSATVVALTFLIHCVSPLHAQRRGEESELAVFSIGTLVGAVAAGIRALIEGSDIDRAFLRGAIGGAVNHAGKRIAVSGGDAAPVTGRFIASLGSDIAAHATHDGALLDTLAFPVGPAWLRLSLSDGKPRLTLLANEVIALAQALTTPGLRLDWSRSLALATPVFTTGSKGLRLHGQDVLGLAAGSLVVIDERSSDLSDRIFAHEMVHVIQHDYLRKTLDRPLEMWLRRETGAEAILPDWLELGILGYVAARTDRILSDDGTGYVSALLEREAQWFDSR